MNDKKLFFFLTLLAFAKSFPVDELPIRNRISSHQLIGDYGSAVKEALEAVRNYPENQVFEEDLIRAYLKAGNEKDALLSWKRYAKKYPEKSKTRGILEDVAWGVIENGAKSSYPQVRLIALIASYLGQDARGVDLLERGLKDQNSRLRQVALQLVKGMYDKRLQALVFNLAKKEPLYDVRAEAIKCLGTMQIKEAIPELTRIVAERNLGDKLRVSAIASLVLLKKDMTSQDLLKLSGSERSGFRELALAVIDHNESFKDVGIAFQLLNDPSRDVRKSAIHTLVFMRDQEGIGAKTLPRILPLLQDEDDETAMMAAWGVTILDPQNKGYSFSPWIFSEFQEKRLKAASLLAKTGKHGLSFAKEAFLKSQDLYVKMNLGMYLLSHNINEAQALELLFRGLNYSKDRWMWKEFLFTEYLAPSTLRFEEEIGAHPEAINQAARLQVLALLASKRFPEAKEAIRKFLKEKTWGISANASALLLSESDPVSCLLIEELLEDKDEKISLQAALILSLWGNSPKAVDVLIKNFSSSDREKKLFIIEALGSAKDERALPFLVNLLQENYPTLRIAAAVSVIKTLYQ